MRWLRVSQMNKPIASHMIIADVLSRWPATIPVFQKYQMGCVGCAIAPFETLAEAARIYNLSLAELLYDLNQAVCGEGVPAMIFLSAWRV